VLGNENYAVVGCLKLVKFAPPVSWAADVRRAAPHQHNVVSRIECSEDGLGNHFAVHPLDQWNDRNRLRRGFVLPEAAADLELAPEDRGQCGSESRLGRDQLLKIVVTEAQQRAVPVGEDGSRARVAGNQGEFADRRSATKHAKNPHRLIVLAANPLLFPQNNLQPSGIDDVERVARVPLSHQPVAGLDRDLGQLRHEKRRGLRRETAEERARS